MTPDNKAALAEKVLSAATPVEATAVVQEVKATVASEATVLAMRRKMAITMLKQFLALSITCATIYCAIMMVTIPDTLTNALFVVLGYYLREKQDDDKTMRDHNTRSTDR
jgi:hypothetical protein